MPRRTIEAIDATRQRKARRLLALMFSLIALPSHAHDLWIEPSSFRPTAGEPLTLRLQVGTNLAGEPLPLIPQLVRRFIVRSTQQTPDGREQPVSARRAGTDPAGQWRATAMQGLYVVSYQSHASRVDLEAAKFNAYLLEEGLEAVLEQRTQQGRRDTPTSERFARCAKSLLQIGEADALQQDIDLGCTLELVTEANPYVTAKRTSAELPFRLSYLGKPLPGALVVAMNAKNPAQALSARSDEQGRVRLTLTSAGMWLVKAVHTVPAAAGVDAEWQSYWASVTFER